MKYRKFLFILLFLVKNLDSYDYNLNDYLKYRNITLTDLRKYIETTYNKGNEINEELHSSEAFKKFQAKELDGSFIEKFKKPEKERNEYQKKLYTQYKNTQEYKKQSNYEYDNAEKEYKKGYKEYKNDNYENTKKSYDDANKKYEESQKRYNDYENSKKQSNNNYRKTQEQYQQGSNNGYKEWKWEWKTNINLKELFRKLIIHDPILIIWIVFFSITLIKKYINNKKESKEDFLQYFNEIKDNKSITNEMKDQIFFYYKIFEEKLKNLKNLEISIEKEVNSKFNYFDYNIDLIKNEIKRLENIKSEFFNKKNEIIILLNFIKNEVELDEKINNNVKNKIINKINKNLIIKIENFGYKEIIRLNDRINFLKHKTKKGFFSNIIDSSDKKQVNLNDQANNDNLENITNNKESLKKDNEDNKDLIDKIKKNIFSKEALILTSAVGGVYSFYDLYQQYKKENKKNKYKSFSQFLGKRFNILIKNLFK